MPARRSFLNEGGTRHYTHVGDHAASMDVVALLAFTDKDKGNKQNKQQKVKTLDDLGILSKVRLIIEKSTSKTWAKDTKKVLKLILAS